MDIGTFVRPPDRERLAEVLVPPHHSHVAGDIRHAGPADGAVYQKPEQRLAGVVDVALQHGVQKNHWTAQVPEEIAHPVLDRFRDGLLVDIRDRLEDVAVSLDIDREDRAVERFERIVDPLEVLDRFLVVRRRRRRTAQGPQDPNDKQGGKNSRGSS